MMYAFQLGREPDLSFAEVETLLAAQNISFVKKTQEGSYCILDIQSEISPDALMERLGGTIKIGSAVQPYRGIGSIAEFLVEAQPEGKIEFSLQGNIDPKEGFQIKKLLKEQGRSVRYIEKNNTATILHNQLVEKQGDLFVGAGQVFVTRAIQPIEAFGERDFGRPASDSQSGMLPPKLARMMINLSGAGFEDVLWDPFCGSGTILMEAAAMGFRNLHGSDISKKAIEDTKKNFNWVKKVYDKMGLGPGLGLGVLDIRNVNTNSIINLKKDGVSVIVSEPYLGKPRRGHESRAWLEKQAAELKELYVDAFRVFSQVLSKDGSVVFIIPKFRLDTEWVAIDCVEEIKKIGFTASPPLTYHRPQQYVARGIWRFRKK